MSDIFISYAADDRDRVSSLVQALEKTGWTIFWDRTIPAGKTWRQRLDAEIQTCRSLVVVWTQKSVNSEWVMEEAEIGKRKQILVPVLFDEVDPPFGFGSIQAANLVMWNGSDSDASFTHLVSDIQTVVGAPAKGSDAESRCRLKKEPERKSERDRLAERELGPANEKATPNVEGEHARVSEGLKSVQAPPRFPGAEPISSIILRMVTSVATKSCAWFRQIAGTFVTTLIVSVTLLVVCQIKLGWDLTPREVSVIVLFVWFNLVAITSLCKRLKSKRTHGID
jgi:TIR domain